MPTLSIVIPAFNEEARLPALLHALSAEAAAAASFAGFELAESLIVDDGSEDSTAEMLARAAGPHLRPVLSSDGHGGKGAAVARGVRRARAEYVLLADADLSTPLSELGKLATAVRAGVDIAVGSRAVAGAVVERGPAHRKLTGRGFSLAVRLLTGLNVRDTQNGFKLLPTPIARELLSEQLCPGFAFDVELLLRAELAGLRMEEVPVLYVHDSRSRVRVARASTEMLVEVTRLTYRLRGKRRNVRVGG